MENLKFLELCMLIRACAFYLNTGFMHLRQIKKYVGLKILGRVGTHIFFNIFFLEKYIMHFGRHFAFHNA